MNKPDIASELYSADIPVVLCDRNLIAVDLNGLARKQFSGIIVCASFEKYLELHECRTIKSIFYCVENGINRNTYHAVVRIKGLKKAHLAVVYVRRYFGKCFFEFSFFKNKSALLENIPTLEMIYPPKAYRPCYDLAYSKDAAFDITEKLSRVFQNNMLANLYEEALYSSENTEAFDIIALTRMLTVDISKKLDFLCGAFRFESIGVEWNVALSMGIGNFINLYTLLLYLTSGISSGGNINISVGKGKEHTSIVFKLKTVERDVFSVGEFAFALIAEMFPEYETFVYIIAYMCELFGVSCFADMDSSGILLIELNLTDKWENEEFTVMHDESPRYKNMLDNAEKLLDLLSMEN